MQSFGKAGTGMRVGLCVVLVGTCFLVTGCQEAETLKRELIKAIQERFLKKKQTFTPREGMTMRDGALHQAANPNSDVIRTLPAETVVHLTDRIGEWYRVRSRDGKEGYLYHKVVGGEDYIKKTIQLRNSIEGMPVQAKGVTKSKANFRLEPGRGPTVVEVLEPGKKFEMYERVVTLRKPPKKPGAIAHASAPVENEAPSTVDSFAPPERKDVWYKVKIEDGRVGYIYTHNLRFTPPPDIGGLVGFLRIVAWRVVSTVDDPDMGSKNNYVAAYAKIGKDSGCDYTNLYFIKWDQRQKRHRIWWQVPITGILPITDYHYKRRPGFSVRTLHPHKRDKLVMASYIYTRNGIKRISEEEIPDPRPLH